MPSTGPTAFSLFAGIYKEYEEGLSYYRFIENLNKNFEDLKEEIVSNLKETLDIILRKENLLIDITASETSVEMLTEPMLKALEKPMAEASLRPEPEGQESRKKGEILPCVKSALRQAMQGVQREAYTTAGMVQYDACAGDFARAGYSYHGAFKCAEGSDEL